MERVFWCSRDRRRRSSRSRSRGSSRRSSRRSRSRSPLRRDSPPWRRSPPPPRRLPGPERRDVMPFTPRRSPPPNARQNMSSEERDERTVFILQLARHTRPRDLEEFFSSVGHVRDVRVITDTKTRRSKGIAYVEFWEKEAVPLAMGLNGQKVLGAPLIIQMTYSERNRAANQPTQASIGLGITNVGGPLKLCVSNLHPNITDDMLMDIFEPFGKVDRCEVNRDSTDSSKGFGFVTFRYAEEGRRALEQLNGFELAGRNIRLTTVDDEEQTQRPAAANPPPVPVPQQPPVAQEQVLSLEEKNLTGSQGRLELMAKLAQGTDMQVPEAMQTAIVAHQQQQQNPEGIPDIATQCFMLSNMFDPAVENEPGWDLDVRDDVIEECNSHGGIVHIYVDKASPDGNIYVKCPTVAIAHRSVVALHGRWFAGKVITANYVPVSSYHELFPDARSAQTFLRPRPRE